MICDHTVPEWQSRDLNPISLTGTWSVNQFDILQGSAERPSKSVRELDAWPAMNYNTLFLGTQ